MVGSDFSNERDMAHSTQKDSCAAPEEFVGVGSEVNRTTKTSNDCDTPRASGNRPQRQSSLVDGFDSAAKRNLNVVWANFFYAANIPFAVA